MQFLPIEQSSSYYAGLCSEFPSKAEQKLLVWNLDRTETWKLEGKKEGKLKILSLVSTARPLINLSIKKLKGCSCSTQAIKRIKIPAKFKVSTTSQQYFWPWLEKIHFNNIRRKCPSRLLTLFRDL